MCKLGEMFGRRKHEVFFRRCRGKSSVEGDVQMCLRAVDCEVNSLKCPMKDTFVNLVLAPSGTLHAFNFVTG